MLGRLIHQTDRGRWGLRGLDLTMRPSLAFIANLGPSVFPFTHRHLGLPRGIIAAPLQLKIAVLIAHHPVIGNTPLGLQTEHLLQFARCRWLAVIVLWLGRLARKPCVVMGQIFFLQKTIRRFVRSTGPRSAGGVINR